MKVKKSKKITHQLRHAPLSTEMERPVGKLRAPKGNSSKNDKDDDDIIIGDNDDDTYDQEEHKIQKKIVKDVSEFKGVDFSLTHQNNSSKQRWMNVNDSDDDEVIDLTYDDD
jgi:hypothetical protein